MEEDLEILNKELANIRNLIDYYTYENLDYDKKFRMERFQKAIKNLIEENEQLKQDNINLNDKLQMTKNSVVIGNLDVVDDKTLKSKAEKMIEKLDKEEKQELKGIKGQDRYFIKQIYQAKRSAIQELLQEN